MNTAPQPYCLIAEEQALIGMALEAYLEEEGFTVAGSFATGAEALAWTRRATPEVALLDYKLRDGLCIDLARTLLRRGVPVVIYSGLPPGPDLPPELRAVPWIEKPCDRARLLGVLVSLTAAQPAAPAFGPA